MPRAKNPFENVDFSTLNGVPWLDVSQGMIKKFRCPVPKFEAYLRDAIQEELAESLLSGYALIAQGHLAAYAMIQADSLRVVNEVGKSQKLSKADTHYTYLPAIKLRFLAADKRAPKAGTRLMEWLLSHVAEALATQVGARVMTLDAYRSADRMSYDSGPYYKKKFNFNYVGTLTNDGFRSMYLDLLPLIQRIKK